VNPTPAPPPVRVLADVFWHTGHSLPGVLRLDREELVLEQPRGQGSPVKIPLQSVDRAAVETTFRMLPALAVWHQVEGREVCSRFEFGHEDDDDQQDDDFGLADRMGPGLAREAAGRLEGGLRALTGGINRGMRTARQAVDGLARIEEYQAWPAAITSAKTSLRGKSTTKAETATIPPAGSLVPAHAAFPLGNAETRYTWFREQLVPWLMACGTRARELGVRGAPIIQADYPLDSPICRIVVAGEFSRGKSTMINALFGIHGEIALPTGMTPTTPLACAIRVPRVGETDGATITYRTDRPARALSIEEFRAGVRLAEGRGTAEAEQVATELHLSEARRVEVRITGAYLPAGVEIEDTPGLNEQARRSAGALAALGRADIILFVLAADQLLGDLERDIIHNTLAAGRHRNVLFLINFWDTIEDDGQKAVLLQRATAGLGSFPTPFAGSETGTGMPHVFTLAALSAVRAQRQRRPAPEDSGIPVLRGRLRELLGPGSQALLLRARAGRALRYCVLLREAISSTAANVQAKAEGRPDGKAPGRKGDVEAALRVIEGLESAVEGAVSRPLALLSDGDMLIQQDTERGRVAAVRVALGDVTRAAGAAMDFVLAQVRAIYLTRGVQAPSFDASIDAPIDPPIPGGPDESIFAYRERAADQARTILTARTKAAQVALAAALGKSEPTRRPTDGAEARSRVEALHLLEEDILRLERILTDALG
jgi:hypothetical protein